MRRTGGTLPPGTPGRHRAGGWCNCGWRNGAGAGRRPVGWHPAGVADGSGDFAVTTLDFRADPVYMEKWFFNVNERSGRP